ncbi:uncharacterized protein LOC142590637 [Dermacentor variabilis]|uniref:uncharacterized protein LOC142590637 n=1 Tax=Dermacentor variabilis TaxID=34621 RepID=UPI003F5BF9CB
MAMHLGEQDSNCESLVVSQNFVLCQDGLTPCHLMLSLSGFEREVIHKRSDTERVGATKMPNTSDKDKNTAQLVTGIASGVLLPAAVVAGPFAPLVVTAGLGLAAIGCTAGVITLSLLPSDKKEETGTSNNETPKAPEGK